VVGRQNADIADTVQLRDVAMATTFWLSMGYNFSCIGPMIASDTLFGSGWVFGDKLSNEDTAQIDRRSKGVAMATNFGTTLAAIGL